MKRIQAAVVGIDEVTKQWFTASIRSDARRKLVGHLHDNLAQNVELSARQESLADECRERMRRTAECVQASIEAIRRSREVSAESATLVHDMADARMQVRAASIKAAQDAEDKLRPAPTTSASFGPIATAVYMQLDTQAPVEKDVTCVIEGLTIRELEVLKGISEGHPTKAIAASLDIAAKTVEKHRQTLMEKTGLHHIAGLTRLAIANKVTLL